MWLDIHPDEDQAGWFEEAVLSFAFQVTYSLDRIPFVFWFHFRSFRGFCGSQAIEKDGNHRG